MNNPCDNGLVCDGLETCTADGGQAVCSAGTLIVCPTGVCAEPNGVCTGDPCMHNPCDNGLACDGLETCIADGGQAVCSDGPSVFCVLPRCFCTEPDGACVDPTTHEVCTATCTVDTECDDFDSCTENDACGEDGVCAGTRIFCPAGLVCTEPNGICSGDPCMNNPCDDGIACNGLEICTLAGGSDFFCDPGTPVVCGPNEVCTVPDGDCTPIPGCLPVTRTVAISPPSGSLVYGVEDNPPAGWTVSKITNDGEYDAANNAVKWFFLDDNPRTLSYTATPPTGTTESHCFSGIVNYDGGANVATTQECFQCSQ